MNIELFAYCIAVHHLPLKPCIESIDCIGKVNIRSELTIPFSVLDLAVELIKVVFLPAYIRFAINPAILHSKCREVDYSRSFFFFFFRSYILVFFIQKQSPLPSKSTLSLECQSNSQVTTTKKKANSAKHKQSKSNRYYHWTDYSSFHKSKSFRMRNERKRSRKGRRRNWIPGDLASRTEKWHDWSDDNDDDDGDGDNEGNGNGNEKRNDEGR